MLGPQLESLTTYASNVGSLCLNLECTEITFSRIIPATLPQVLYSLSLSLSCSWTCLCTLSLSAWNALLIGLGGTWGPRPSSAVPISRMSTFQSLLHNWPLPCALGSFEHACCCTRHWAGKSASSPGAPWEKGVCPIFFFFITAMPRACPRMLKECLCPSSHSMWCQRHTKGEIMQAGRDEEMTLRWEVKIWPSIRKPLAQVWELRPC